MCKLTLIDSFIYNIAKIIIDNTNLFSIYLLAKSTHIQCLEEKLYGVKLEIWQSY